ncbi:formate dehydrogenase [Salmonella enterica subsp. enterica]|nr:formate dehydrogenase [Salmonella enterica subsp. enterica serovar Enteritidis]
MSPDDDHAMSTDDKLIYMANQIATFFVSQPRDEQAVGVAGHINDFWDPRMRRRFFELVDERSRDLAPLVVEALPRIRKPAPN